MKIRPYEEKDWQRLIVVHDNARMIELTSTGLEAAYLPLVATYESEGLFEYNLLVAEDSNALVALCQTGLMTNSMKIVTAD